MLCWFDMESVSLQKVNTEWKIQCKSSCYIKRKNTNLRAIPPWKRQMKTSLIIIAVRFVLGSITSISVCPLTITRPLPVRYASKILKQQENYTEAVSIFHMRLSQRKAKCAVMSYLIVSILSILLYMYWKYIQIQIRQEHLPQVTHYYPSSWEVWPRHIFQQFL